MKPKKKRGQIQDSRFKPEEWEEPEKGTQWPKAKRLLYLRDLAGSVGLNAVNKSDLAKKFGIVRSALYTDIRTLYDQGVDKDTLAKGSFKLDKLFERALDEAQAYLIDSKGSEKARAIMAAIQAGEKYRENIEAFGIKQATSVPVDQKLTVIFDGKEIGPEGDK